MPPKSLGEADKIRDKIIKGEWDPGEIDQRIKQLIEKIKRDPHRADELQ